ncbi:MAG: baseplate J/gp47 family protein [Ruminococcus sp.]|nr:baseplate J/gp47 family protein [Ruminococcus sp.]
METYDEIYERMKQKYEQESGAQFDEASDIAIRLRVLAGEIYNAQVNMEWLKNQMFVETATGERLDYLAKQRGIVRKSAQKAQGEITFYISEPINHTIIIPKGSVAATAEEIPRRFVTTEDHEITQGNVLVSVSAEAEKAGSSGNTTIGKVTVAVDVPSEIEWVKNREAYVGGTDEESDEELRERIRDSYFRLPNGTNAAYYEQLALTVDGIAKTKAVGKVRGAGTVNVFVSGDGKEAVNTAVNNAQTLISSKRELNVDVKVTNADLVAFDLDVTVYKREEFSDNEIREKCKTAFEKFIKSLGIGERLYLSALGKALLDTGCILNYQFNVQMTDTPIAASQCFKVGNVDVFVK